MKKILSLLKSSVKQSLDDQLTTLSSSLAYSTVFSIAPLLIIITGFAGYFYGNHESMDTVYSSVRNSVGPEGSKAIEGMVKAAAKKPDTGLFTTLAGILVLLLGAASVFQQLQQSLNMIWKVHAHPKSGIWHFIRQKFLSFSMIAVIAFLLLVSLLLNTSIAMLWSHFGSDLPGSRMIWNFCEFVFSFGIITLLFSAVFIILPDVKLRLRDVWIGSVITALLFNIGKFVIGLYLAKESIASAYGAAGSLVVVLLWVYYSSAILFIGAEFTRQLMINNGSQIIPKEGAEMISITPVLSQSEKKDSQAKKRK